eukprot:scaffold426_cov319-Pavlova_lutheri.AAC.42
MFRICFARPCPCKRDLTFRALVWAIKEGSTRGDSRVRGWNGLPRVRDCKSHEGHSDPSTRDPTFFVFKKCPPAYLRGCVLLLPLCKLTCPRVPSRRCVVPSIPRS